jgi:glycosyltransferase involved in cell wall biosynthesis
MITYNHEAYIAQAIEGVLRQKTDFPIELVIGEDCSTDRTREIVLDYQKRYPEIIRVLTADHNVGAFANSRRVHAACAGNYLAYCDGDDWWHHPGKLQMQVDYLERHRDVGLVHTEADWLVADTNKTVPCWHRTHRHAIAQGDIYRDLLVDNQIVTCTVCARREQTDRVMQAGLLARESFRMGDYPAWLLISTASRIGYLDISTATRRELANSASRSTALRAHFAFFLSIYAVKEYFMRSCPPGPLVEAHVRADFHRGKLKYGYLLQDADISRDSYHYLTKHGLLSMTARLHFLGSKGRLPHAVARALIAAKDVSWNRQGTIPSRAGGRRTSG